MLKGAKLSPAQISVRIARCVSLAEFYEERATRLSEPDKGFALADAAEQRQFEREWRAELAVARRREAA